MIAKPLIFVGSSTEGLNVARAIQINLRDAAEVVVWDQGPFALSKTYIESLEELLHQADFAVFVFTADDISIARNRPSYAPRDNVLIEAGLFMGRKGRERTFLVCEGGVDIKVPSDLDGVALATYQASDRTDAEAWVGPASTQIRRAMESAQKRPLTLTPRLGETPESMSFESMMAEYEQTLDRLEADRGELLMYFDRRGDLGRLIDGLFSGLLFASRALVTGYVDPLLYGNLMEWNTRDACLRLRYFAGPYNEEIITRTFPIDQTGKGVASAAFKSNEIQVRNDMESELKVVGEARLKAMLSVPIETATECPDGAIAILNVDCAIIDAFPKKGSGPYDLVEMRARRAAGLMRRVNRFPALPKC